MRPSLAVCVALLVVLAGCAGGAGGPSPSGTAASPAATSSPTPTPTLPPSSVPGVGADGANVTRLTAAHDAALDRTAYTLNVSVEQRGQRQQVTVETTGPLPTLVRRESGTRTRTEYFDNSRFYRRTTAGGDTSYQMGPFRGNPAFSGAGLLRQYMSVAQYEVARTATHDGTPVVVLAAEREDLQQNDVIPVDTTESFSSRARVDADGVVRSFTLTARGTAANGRPFVLRVDLRVTEIGDTVVGAPPWLDEAREATSGETTSGTTTNNDTTSGDATPNRSATATT
jgi:hypothetical protein